MKFDLKNLKGSLSAQQKKSPCPLLKNESNWKQMIQICKENRYGFNTEPHADSDTNFIGTTRKSGSLKPHERIKICMMILPCLCPFFKQKLSAFPLYFFSRKFIYIIIQ